MSPSSAARFNRMRRHRPMALAEQAFAQIQRETEATRAIVNQ